MAVNIQPLANYVLAQLEEAPNRTASGLYLPDKATEKSQVAKVLAIGKEVQDVTVDDRIIYKSYAQTTVKVDSSEEYLLIKAEDVLAVIKESE